MTQQIELQQKQTASPRLQLAVRLLQMSSLDFAATLQDMMGRNPFLEADDGPAAPEDLEAATDANEEADSDREVWADGDRNEFRRADEAEMSALEMTAHDVTLHEHLLQQINVQRLPERERLLAGVVAEALDDDGYLRVPLEELVPVSGLLPAPPPHEMTLALRRVQGLDPAGVGARDIAECLRLQLGHIDCAHQRLCARTILDEHLPLLAARDIKRIAAALGITPGEADAVCTALRRLDPRPGSRFDSPRVVAVVPDVIAFKSRGRWQVKLNAAALPRVRLHEVYAELYRRHRADKLGEMERQLDDARWTMRNIEVRFATILDVAGAIVRRQAHFLDFGAMAMKPMSMNEIAQEVGMHESTVCRVSNNKFIATPAGVFELRYFFTRRLIGSDGRASSGLAMRGLIQKMIEAEPAGSPLSDSEIARRLERQGLKLARRTVTKYRQMLKIDAQLRRKRSTTPIEGIPLA